MTVRILHPRPSDRKQKKSDLPLKELIGPGQRCDIFAVTRFDAPLDYLALRTTFQIRMIFAGHYGIYYVADEAEKRVHALFIEDQRRDSLNRFYELHPHPPPLHFSLRLQAAFKTAQNHDPVAAFS